MIGAVIYVRVSDPRQAANLSLGTQLKTCEEYCRREGFQILERFREDGESAKTTDRTELQKLLRFCRSHKGSVHFVVVYNLTRFARETFDHFALRSHLKSLGISLRSAIGKVVQTIGLGPHRMNPKTRPAWFFEKARYGGILTDIGSHQFEQFLYFTNSTDATIVASQVRNVHHPQYPGLEDFGDVMLRGNGGATGYIRVDWFTPDGLATWGDGRLTVLGTDGYMELRKYIDIGGRTGGSHLFLVDQKETRYIDCNDVTLTYGDRLVDDVVNRTETAMPQAHTFKAMELALTAESQAQQVK